MGFSKTEVNILKTAARGSTVRADDGGRGKLWFRMIYRLIGKGLLAPKNDDHRETGTVLATITEEGKKTADGLSW